MVRRTRLWRNLLKTQMERKLESMVSGEPRNSPLKTKHLYALDFRKSRGTRFESSLGHGEVHNARLDTTATLDIASPMDCWESPCPAEQDWRITLVVQSLHH